jgi:hypothetical protein
VIGKLDSEGEGEPFDEFEEQQVDEECAAMRFAGNRAKVRSFVL